MDEVIYERSCWKWKIPFEVELEMLVKGYAG